MESAISSMSEIVLALMEKLPDSEKDTRAFISSKVVSILDSIRVYHPEGSFDDLMFKKAIDKFNLGKEAK
jgi:hypothetical protein